MATPETFTIDTSEITKELEALEARAAKLIPATPARAVGFRVMYSIVGAAIAASIACVLAGQGCVEPEERTSVFIENTHTETVTLKDERVEQLQRELATAKTALSTWERRTVKPVAVTCDGGAPVIAYEVVEEKGTSETREERLEAESTKTATTKTETRTEETRDVETREVTRPVLPSWAVGGYGGAQLGFVPSAAFAVAGGYRLPLPTARVSVWVDGLFVMQVPTAEKPLQPPALLLGGRVEF